MEKKIVEVGAEGPRVTLSRGICVLYFYSTYGFKQRYFYMLSCTCSAAHYMLLTECMLVIKLFLLRGL